MATKRTAERSTGGTGAGAFTLQEVKALVDAIEGTDVTSLVWARAGHKVVIRRGQPAPAAVQVLAPVAPVAPVLHASPPPPAAAPAPAKAEKAEKAGALVTSPFVGTFYRAPSPDSPPYVDVGTRVKKGQVLCIVEAMKLMNEIEAEVEGLVAEILTVNAAPVEFGQPLFRIEPG
jgi:acetyl-CoA carboxylase biotin carboxyl carrier protein